MMGDRKELLKRLLRNEIPREVLDLKPWVFVARTLVDGQPVAEDIFATPTPHFLSTERIGPGKALRISQLSKKGIPVFFFLHERDFPGTPRPWAPFDAREAVAYAGEHHEPATPGVIMIPHELYLIS